MLKNKVIKPLNSPYTFNIVIIRKKDNVNKGMDRIYINYLLFNDVIEKNSGLIFNIKEYLLFFYKVK